MSETTVDDPTRSKHILVVGSDYVDYREHMDLDTVVQKCLNESENERLKNPITPDDYLALFKLIVENTPHHIVYKMEEEHVETVKIKFLDPGVESSEWKEFTRMLDMCLKRGRYRAVRVMCKYA